MKTSRRSAEFHLPETLRPFLALSTLIRPPRVRSPVVHHTPSVMGENRPQAGEPVGGDDGNMTLPCARAINYTESPFLWISSYTDEAKGGIRGKVSLTRSAVKRTRASGT